MINHVVLLYQAGNHFNIEIKGLPDRLHNSNYQHKLESINCYSVRQAVYRSLISGKFSLDRINRLWAEMKSQKPLTPYYKDILHNAEAVGLRTLDELIPPLYEEPSRRLKMVAIYGGQNKEKENA